MCLECISSPLEVKLVMFPIDLALSGLALLIHLSIGYIENYPAEQSV